MGQKYTQHKETNLNKTYVLDTNVILFDADSIFKFDEHTVVIPITVIEEVDHFKKAQDETGRNARRFARHMDDLRAAGSLTNGVPLPNGGMLKVALYTDNLALSSFDMSVPDNRILAIAKWYATYDCCGVTSLVTKDVNLRIKADAVGIKAADYENSKVDIDELYSGFRDVRGVPEEYIDNPRPNEFFLRDSGTTRFVNGEYLPALEEIEAWGLTPRNEEQRYAMELLLDDNIKLVTLVGKAGCGKTLMAIAAGLRKVTDDFVYRRLLVSRPVMPFGKDIGFLPGTLEEKYSPWLQPVYDAVEYLMSGYPTSAMPKVVKKATKKKASEADDKSEGPLAKGHLELVNAGIMEIEPLIHIRGRSIPNQYLVIDEAQQLSPHEIKTIITRAGEGTKIVLTGDPWQIDNPYLDASSNGLTYVVERFRDQSIAGHVTLQKCERSELASLAAELL